LDQWHGILLGTVTTLCSVIAALWRHIVLTRREQDAKDLKQDQELSELHDEHKRDIRQLTQASLKLGLSVIARMQPLDGLSESQETSPESEPKLEP
jgi:type II secretory pathway component PulM